MPGEAFAEIISIFRREQTPPVAVYTRRWWGRTDQACMG
jgi:hypothetical protein